MAKAKQDNSPASRNNSIDAAFSIGGTVQGDVNPVNSADRQSDDAVIDKTFWDKAYDISPEKFSAAPGTAATMPASAIFPEHDDFSLEKVSISKNVHATGGETIVRGGAKR